MTEPTDVLVIDDSATIRKVVEMSMRGSGFRPHFSASGADGVAEARRLHPAAILLDCVLPDSSGLQICRELAADARTGAIPVLLVSAKAEAVREDFRGYPFVVDFITKPFTGPDLLRRLKRAIAGSEAAPPPPRFDRARQERAAKILYARLRDGLATIPAAVTQLGTSPPGPYLAKRLLTPDAVAAILDDLYDLYEEVRAETADKVDAVDPIAPSVVLDRAGGFSARVRGARLGTTERRVLAVVNGLASVDEIAQRVGLDVGVVGAVARGLVERGLLEDCGSPVRMRPVVILEPDIQGFRRPLASLLEARPEAPALVAVATVGEVVSTVRRVRPCLVVVNATGESSMVGNAARELRADHALADVALVAILDQYQQTDRDDLYSAGFDAVLSKPIIVGDLERFITQ